MSEEGRQIASHEAAHAVVGVRLRLPVHYTTTRVADLSEEDRRRTGKDGVSRGRTPIDPTLFPSAQAGQPLTRAQRDAHDHLAVMIAAGLVVERRCFGEAGMTDGGLADLCALVETANILGIISAPAGSEVALADHPEFEPWMNERMNEADAVLHQDGGAAWDRVRFALERKRHLTGEQVRELVAESDATTRGRVWAS